MEWFTSDLHLGHSNIAGPEVSNWKDGYRTFKTTEEMDYVLLKGINDHVSQDDTLYFLGDFCLSKRDKDVKIYRDRIVCKNIVFIKGNHDKPREILHAFGHIYDYLEEDFDGIKFCMMHYALRVWNKSHRGSIHLYGHSHERLETEPWGKSMDAGIDNAIKLLGEWRPFSLDEILKIMEKRVPKLIDHHGTSEDKHGTTRKQ